MSDLKPELIKELREKTGIGFLKCKEALQKTGGDVEKAVEELRKQGLQTAEKKAGRTASQGSIIQYSHGGGKIGVMLELNCETDFVARTDDFQALGKDLCMHIAASNPEYVCREEVPQDLVTKEKEIAAATITGKPPAVVEKIVDGRLKKFYEEKCLLEQPFIKDDTKSVEAMIKGAIAKTGENIRVRRFVRMEMSK